MIRRIKVTTITTIMTRGLNTYKEIINVDDDDHHLSNNKKSEYYYKQIYICKSKVLYETSNNVNVVDTTTTIAENTTENTTEDTIENTIMDHDNYYEQDLSLESLEQDEINDIFNELYTSIKDNKGEHNEHEHDDDDEQLDDHTTYTTYTTTTNQNNTNYIIQPIQSTNKNTQTTTTTAGNTTSTLSMNINDIRNSRIFNYLNNNYLNDIFVNGGNQTTTTTTTTVTNTQNNTITTSNNSITKIIKFKFIHYYKKQLLNNLKDKLSKIMYNNKIRESLKNQSMIKAKEYFEQYYNEQQEQHQYKESTIEFIKVVSLKPISKSYKITREQYINEITGFHTIKHIY